MLLVERFSFLFGMLSVGALVMGMIMPGEVMVWSKNKSRGRVVLVFGSAILLFFGILFYTKISMPYNTPMPFRALNQ
jgi:hypothetical protein